VVETYHKALNTIKQQLANPKPHRQREEMWGWCTESTAGTVKKIRSERQGEAFGN